VGEKRGGCLHTNKLDSLNILFKRRQIKLYLLFSVYFVLLVLISQFLVHHTVLVCNPRDGRNQLWVTNNIADSIVIVKHTIICWYIHSF
jgi:hypothetical protein